MNQARLRSAACSHTGLVRKHNEDAFLDRPDLGLWVVADGMGGMTAGEVASGTVVTELEGIVPALDGPSLLAEIRARLAAVNARLLRMAQSRGPGVTIGTTVAGLVLRDGHFACFWAGDSRVYRLRRGELDQLTRDHSLVQDMVDSGLLRPEDAERHPHASVIQRAVGVDDTLQLEWTHAPVHSGDLFLLCSDGLTRMVRDEELERTLGQWAREQGTPDEACAALLALTLQRGARDNVTLVLVAP